MIKRIPVVSSTIASVGYDNATGTMEVEFVSGAVYRYYEVPQATYQGLCDASSLGRFFNVHVRDDFRYVRLRGAGRR